MTDLIEAARTALDAMKRYQVKRQDFDRFADEITNLRDAIEATESAKPVAWVLTEELDARRTTSNAHLLFSDQEIFAWTPWTPVWTHPPEPARQPMPEREIIGGFEVLPEALTFFTAFEAGVRHAERRHRIGSEEGATT